MAVGVWSPVVPEKANDLLLGEGIVYKNMGEVSEVEMGATRGGSELMLNREIKMVAYDGALGDAKGMKRITTFKPQLKINFLKISYDNIAYGLPVTVSDGSDSYGTYKKTTFDLDIDSTDVLTNIGFKGYKADGTVCKLFLYNALNIDSITLKFESKDEVVAPMIYTGFYDYTTSTTPPFEIWEYVAA